MINLKQFKELFFTRQKSDVVYFASNYNSRFLIEFHLLEYISGTLLWLWFSYLANTPIKIINAM